ncbi:MAG: hypothetical protein IKZ53_05780 [Selenomonadaceae bacterium]|nr:hypothetical protein [Selenomonadaceae bacterium]
MRKILLMTAAIFFVLTNTAFAAQSFKNVGVIIVGGAEFKTSDYYKIIKSEVKPISGSKIVFGNDLQTLYKKYWLQQGYIGEQVPQKDDLINFTNMSGCDKIICLIVADSVVDKHNSSNHREKSRVSVQLDAYICTKTEVVDVLAATNEQTSKGSDLRARRGAFQKCLKEIGKTLNDRI